MRYAFVFVVSVAALGLARGAEPWADPGLPVRGGLGLWLDAARANGATAAKDGPLAEWADGSGAGRTVRQAEESRRPRLVRVGGAAVVRFDGEDDFLRVTGRPGELTAFTVFLVVAPRANPGGFRGLLAFNADDRRDYETGLTIDLGPFGTPRFTQLNVEGRGFGAWQNLLKPGGPFAKLTTLEVVGDPAARRVRLVADGKPSGERPWAPAALSRDGITVGARYYTNGPGPQEVRGFAKADVAEVLVYDRALSDAEARQVREYLARKHAALREALPPDGDGRAAPLVPVENPPPVQVFLPGFTARELPLDLTNINNLKYRPDGTLVALAYDGNVWHLSDTDGDGLEDKAELFWDNKGRLRGPIGMDLTPPGYPHGDGVFVASKGKCSLIVDTDRDGKADREIVIATGWKELPHGVDALGVAVNPKDQSIYFGLGCTDYTNAYQVGKDGKARYSLTDEHGTVMRIAPDLKSREIVATGIRFPVGLRFNKAGDLFATDQEGATWLPNGNPFDELLHIEKGKHYGFPPRHPKHLPGVIDEPSVFDYGPQHQSTCGLNFNEPVRPDGPTFGPEAWVGDVFVAGYSRGKLYRTQLVKTDAGYVARNHLFACLNMLTVDACVAPDGGLVVACHSGGPDWGNGPTGKGKLYKITYTDRDHPQPVLVWPAGPREVRVEFDRPVDPALLRDVLKHTRLTAGKYVRAGDRFESLWPGYEVVQQQKAAPRYEVAVRSAQLTPDRRTLVLATDPMSAAVHYALTLPGMGRPAKPVKGELAQHAVIDLDFDLSGCEAVWKAGESAWTGWLPHPDLAVARRFTVGSAPHETLWEAMNQSGDLRLSTQFDLSNMLRPAVQPGSRFEYESKDAAVRLLLTATGKFALEVDSASISKESPPARPDTVSNLQMLPAGRTWGSVAASVRTSGNPVLGLSWSTIEDRTPRPFTLNRAILPWADVRPAALDVPAVAKLAPELEGGSWARGRAVFFDATHGCAKCHAVGGEGGTIGPDLSNLVHRDYASVHRDVTKPGFAINPDFLTHVVNLADGRTLTGVVRTEGEKLVVGDQTGKATVVAKSEVDSVKPSPASTMPDDVLKPLTPAQQKDLFTFLLTAPPSMPRDYAGTERRPAPRRRAEVLAVLAGAPEPAAKTRKIRVVLVAGPKDHGPGEHDYPAWQKAWAELLATADNVEVATAWEWPAKEEFQKADVMVFYQHGDWTAKRAADVDAFLERGGGLVYIHWAVDGRAGGPEFAKRIGLAARGAVKFRHGPLDLTFNKTQHPAARNFDRLKLVDESYWAMVGELPADRVLATQIEEKAPRPLFWTTEPAKGRVFVSIPGHYSWTFDDPLFRVLLLRGIAWSAREPVDRFNALVWPGADVAK